MRYPVGNGTGTVSIPLSARYVGESVPGITKTKYYYKVTAFSSSNQPIADSPQNITAYGPYVLDGDHSVALSWSPIIGAAYYLVYKKMGGEPDPNCDLFYKAGFTETGLLDVGYAATTRNPDMNPGCGPRTIGTGVGSINGISGDVNLVAGPGIVITPGQPDGQSILISDDDTPGVSVFTTLTPPPNPLSGWLWFDPVGTQLYIWYQDPTSSQWVVTTNQLVGGGIVVLQGTVQNISDLPSLGNKIGDAYVVESLGHLFVWNGTTWIDSGPWISGGGGAAPTNYFVDQLLIGSYPSVNFISGSNVVITGAANIGASRIDITINSTGGGSSLVSSVFGRQGDIVAQATDYASYYVPLTRTINTGIGLSGGGSLASNLTLVAPIFAGANTVGIVPNPGPAQGTRFLREDATWAIPAGGGGGGGGTGGISSITDVTSSRNPDGTIYTNNTGFDVFVTVIADYQGGSSDFTANGVLGTGFNNVSESVVRAPVSFWVRPGQSYSFTLAGTVTNIQWIEAVGSAAGGSYNLPIASASVLGGVKIGSGVSIAGDGTISVSGWGGGDPAGIPGQVQFNLDGIDFGADPNLFWDDTNGRLLIGAPPSPNGQLHIYNATAAVSMRLQSPLATAYNGIFIQNDNRTWTIGVAGSSTGAFNNCLYFQDGGNVRFAINVNACAILGTNIIGTQTRLLVLGANANPAPSLSFSPNNVQNIAAFQRHGQSELVLSAVDAYYWMQTRNLNNAAFPLCINPLGGSVNIATTTPDPAHALNVAGDINIVDPGGAGGFQFRINGTTITPGGGGGGSASSGTAWQIQFADGTGGFQTTSNLVYNNSPVQLGIGRSPGSGFALDTGGNIRAETSVTSGTFTALSPGTKFSLPGGGIAWSGGSILIFASNVGTRIGLGYGSVSGNVPSTTDVLNLVGGRVGIGTINPGYTLDVVGGDINIATGNNYLINGNPIGVPVGLAGEIQFNNGANGFGSQPYLSWDFISNPNAGTLNIIGNVNITGQYLVNSVPVLGVSLQSLNLKQTGLRDVDTVYHNQTGRPVFVMVTGTLNPSWYLTAATNGLNPPTQIVATIQNQSSTLQWNNVCLFFIVLPGNYYLVSCQQEGAVGNWVEWS